ncbi:MAG: hypothetical protein IPH54_15270 [Rhodoferax sp.]|nr:hypothetical protein [Rhodoferax sp.]
MLLQQAVYGASAGHALLKSSDAALAVEFRNVAWRTDLPQTCPAGVDWAPYFRLIKEAGWMMLVHTRRDAAADRGGMVLSRAAFIPVGEIETLDDLRSVAAVLASPWSDGDPLDPIELAASAGADRVSDPPKNVVAIATALSHEGPRPIVTRQGDGLEEAMFELWRRAPPEYRSKLTFGLSFGPNDVHELSVVCTPEALISHWIPAQVIDLGAEIEAGPHAVTILDLPAEASVRDFAKQVGLRLDSPTAISIAVQAFDLWRQAGKPDEDILLLRMLIEAADNSPGAEAAKSAAAKRVLASAVDWNVDNLMVMRNLDFSGLREAQMLSTALGLWVKDCASSVQAVGLKEILIAWVSEKPNPVWLMTVETGLRAASDAKMLQKRGIATVWELLKSETARASRLLTILYDPAQEKQLLEVVDDSVPAKLADALAPELFDKGWWQLGGVLLAHSRSADGARRCALAAAPNDKASRQALLLGALSNATDADLVDIAIAVQDPLVTKMAAQACVRAPSVLKRFNWKRFEWFLLFKEAFTLSPAVLDALPDRKAGLSQTIAARMAVESLWSVVASTPLADIVDVNERANAWDLIPEPHAAKILDATARGWLDRFEHGHQRLISAEPRLSAVVVGIVKQRGYLIDACGARRECSNSIWRTFASKPIVRPISS